MVDQRGAAATAVASWASLGSAAAVLIVEALRRRGRPHRIKLAVPVSHVALFLVAALSATVAAANPDMPCGWAGVFLQLTSVLSAAHIASMFLHLRVVAGRAALDTRVADEVVTYVLGAIIGALSVGVAAAAWDPPVDAPDDTFLDAYMLDPVYGLCTLSFHHISLRVAVQTLPTMGCFIAALGFYSSARRHLQRRRVPAASVRAVDNWAVRTLLLYLVTWIGVWTEDFYVLQAKDRSAIPAGLLYLRAIVYSGQGVLFALFWYGVDEAGSLRQLCSYVSSCRCMRRTHEYGCLCCGEAAAAPLTPKKGRGSRAGLPSYGTLPSAALNGGEDDPFQEHDFTGDVLDANHSLRPVGNLWGLDIPAAAKKTQQPWIGPAPQPLGRGPGGSGSGVAVLGPPSPQLRPPYSPSALDGIVTVPLAEGSHDADSEMRRSPSGSGSSMKSLGISGGARLVATKMSPPQRYYRRLSATDATARTVAVSLSPYEEPTSKGRAGSTASGQERANLSTPSASARYRASSGRLVRSPSSSSASGEGLAPSGSSTPVRVLFAGGSEAAAAAGAAFPVNASSEGGPAQEGESASLLGSPSGSLSRSRFSTRQTSITVLSDEQDEEEDAEVEGGVNHAASVIVAPLLQASPGRSGSDAANDASRSRSHTSGSGRPSAAGLSVSVGLLSGDPLASTAAPPGMKCVRTYTVESDDEAGRELGADFDEDNDDEGSEAGSEDAAGDGRSEPAGRSGSADTTGSLATPARSDARASHDGVTLTSLLADSPLMLASAAGSVRRGAATPAVSSSAPSSLWQSPAASPRLNATGQAAAPQLLLRSPASAARGDAAASDSESPAQASPASAFGWSRPSATGSMESEDFESRLVYELDEEN